MFGLSFGASKTKSKTSTSVDKTETTDQTESGTKASTGTTSNASSGSTQTAQSGTNTNEGATTQQTTGNQASTSTTTQFGDSVLGGLESAVGQLLGNIPTGNQQIGGSFDHDKFVQSGMDAASSRITGDLETSLNSMYDQFGGRDDSNSMVALLANRARSDAGAAQAGAYSSLEAQAQGIDKSRFEANLAGTASTQGYLASILSSLKGGRESTTGNVATSEQQAGTSSQAGTQQQTGSENTQAQSVQMQDLIEQLNNILKGTTHTVGTEDSKTKGSTIGGGAGLSL